MIDESDFNATPLDEQITLNYPNDLTEMVHRMRLIFFIANPFLTNDARLAIKELHIEGHTLFIAHSKDDLRFILECQKKNIDLLGLHMPSFASLAEVKESIEFVRMDPSFSNTKTVCFGNPLPQAWIESLQSSLLRPHAFVGSFPNSLIIREILSKIETGQQNIQIGVQYGATSLPSEINIIQDDHQSTATPFSLNPNPENQFGSRDFQGDHSIQSRSISQFNSPMHMSPVQNHPVDDSVIPGGASLHPDEELLKKYLQLREQDVATLSKQKRTLETQLHGLTEQINELELKIIEMGNDLTAAHHTIDSQKEDRNKAESAIEAERIDFHKLLSQKNQEIATLETRQIEQEKKHSQLKEQVRVDLRKIRVREKDLESKLELSKRDFDAVLKAREQQIQELKRKNETFEYHLELIAEKYENERSHHETTLKQLKDLKATIGRAIHNLDVPIAS